MKYGPFFMPYNSESKGVNPYYVEDNFATSGLCNSRSGNECNAEDGKA